MRLLCLSVALIPLIAAAQPSTLRVCAEPNNLPFSNQNFEGFENRLAEMVAADLGVKLETVWWNARKDVVSHTLNEGRCDLLLGIPANIADAATTAPYYRSTYVFVSRADSATRVSSLNDEILADLRIGIHIAGDDLAPPAFALARRGVRANVTGYSLFGPYGEPNPPARILDALESKQIDVAIVWGPLAGYFAQRSKSPLTITPVSPSMYMAVPFTFEIAAAVREGNTALREQVDRALGRNRAKIDALLRDYGVPQLPLNGVNLSRIE